MNCKKVFEDWRYAVGVVAMSFLLVAVLLSFFLIVASKNVWRNFPYQNTISVKGVAEVKAVPDVAAFNFTVSQISESVDSAQSISAEKTNNAIDFLKQKGVDEKDIKTLSYNIYPKYEWIQQPCTQFVCTPGKQELVGYEVSQNISVKVRKTEMAGELLSGVGALGVSNVGGLVFEIDDSESLKKQALEMAIADAKEKAEDLSKNLNVKLVRIVSFNEEEQYYNESRGGFDMGIKMSEVAMVPEIPAGENTVTSSVYVIYEIK